jgi:hypothetical protein
MEVLDDYEVNMDTEIQDELYSDVVENGVSIQRLYNLQDFCSLIGVTRKTVGDWVKTHHAPHQRVGTEIIINVPDMWAWRIDREKQARKPQSADVNGARARKESAHAEKAELEVEIMKENYLPRNVVERVAFERGQHIKEALNAIPDRLTSVLIGQVDEAVIRKILQDETDRILADLSSKVSNVPDDTIVDEDVTTDFEDESRE